MAAVAAVILPGAFAAAQELREIPYAMPSRSIAAAAPRLAFEMGLFAKHGLRPKFTYLDSTAASTTALISGSVEIAATATAEVIAAEAKGQRLAILANHYTGFSASLVLSKAAAEKVAVKPDAPVAERLKALNTLLLASTTQVSNLTVAYRSAAQSVGATPRFSYMALTAMGAALEAGVVDGIIVTAPYWALPVVKGTGVLWISAPKGELPPAFTPSSAAVTATTRKFAADNPGLVEKLAAVYDDLSAAAAQRPDEVKAALTRQFPELDAKTLDLIVSLEATAFATKPLTPADIARDIEFMRMSGLFASGGSIDPASILLRR